jgi:hypothetical protein
MRAKDGGELDVKAHENTGGYNRIDGTNLIVSPRDVGNIVAGMYARDNHVFGGPILAAFGVFNHLNYSRGGSRTVNALQAGMHAASTMLAPPHQALQMQARMFAMEDPVTIKAIIYGYFIRDR